MAVLNRTKMAEWLPATSWVRDSRTDFPHAFGTRKFVGRTYAKASGRSVSAILLPRGNSAKVAGFETPIDTKRACGFLAPATRAGAEPNVSMNRPSPSSLHCTESTVAHRIAVSSCAIIVHNGQVRRRESSPYKLFFYWRIAKPKRRESRNDRSN